MRGHRAGTFEAKGGFLSRVKTFPASSSKSNMAKILISALAGSIVYFLAGWLVFEGLLGNYMNAHTTQITGFKKTDDEASMGMIFLSCAAYALLLALILGRWSQPAAATLKDGAAIGATVGILVAMMTNFYWYGTSNFFNSLAPVAADVAAAGLTVGLMGGVEAWVLGYLHK